MKNREKHNERNRQPIVASVPGMDEKTSDLLILHYKGKMNAAEIAGILSLEASEVDRIICSFADLFSNERNLMCVIDGLVKMKKRERIASHLDNAPEASAEAQEIAELRRQLKEAQIKAEAYLEMVKVAEQVFKIPIRKKFGAK